MKIAYLIFAYKNPKLMKKEIEALSSDNCAFFIHIDRKSNIADFSDISGRNVFFSNTRIPVYWGEYSGVEAILLLIESALSAPERYDYNVLLSGSEYPLKSKEYIQEYFHHNRGFEFINIVKMPNLDAGKPLSRINTMRFPSSRPASRFLLKILARLGLAQRDYRKHLGTLEPFSGNTWWALTREACEYIFDYQRRNRHFCRYFENTFAPEEMFFHTILGNSPFKGRLKRNVMYEDWSNRGSHPSMVGEEHIKYFESKERIIADDVYGIGECLFSRKYSDNRLYLVDRIADMIKKREPGLPGDSGGVRH